MQIVSFTRDMIGEAKALIEENYQKERKSVSFLPEAVCIPPMESLADNGLSAAAIENGRLLGFLGAYGPWQPAFCTPDTKGVFSPIHAHAVQKEKRIRIWQYLYQAAAEKWIKAGAASHAIALYAHDILSQQALYRYGFGMRCMDLMRTAEPIPDAPAFSCREIRPDEQRALTPLRCQLNAHLEKSPCFMRQPQDTLQQWLIKKEFTPGRSFAAEKDGVIIAYMDAQEEGENFISCHPGIMNICGAYCLPEYRGTGAAQALLSHIAGIFKAEGRTLLGVDCESFNPTALGFWSKHFQPYTHSLVRRIDENILTGTIE